MHVKRASELPPRDASDPEALSTFKWLADNLTVTFEILGEIVAVETIATGRGVRVRARLSRIYGRGRWRKRKGFATVRLGNGAVRQVELHWYEAHGLGRRDFKIKAYTDRP